MTTAHRPPWAPAKGNEETGGARFFGGSARRMAKDVRGALVAAYADVKSLSADAAEQAVAALERDTRYLTDTY